LGHKVYVGMLTAELNLNRPCLRRDSQCPLLRTQRT
jgi:hypothetical protein